jgi:hypothetical protein
MHFSRIYFSLIPLLALLLAGCGSNYQARNVDVKKAMLVKPEILKPGKDDQALYRYVNPSFEISDYPKAMIDPVLVAKDGQLEAPERENYQKLANNAYLYLSQELGKELKILAVPEMMTLLDKLGIPSRGAALKVYQELELLRNNLAHSQMIIPHGCQRIAVYSTRLDLLLENF